MVLDMLKLLNFPLLIVREVYVSHFPDSVTSLVYCLQFRESLVLRLIFTRENQVGMPTLIYS